MEASIAKLYSSAALGRLINFAVQIHGGYGVSKDFPIERWHRARRASVGLAKAPRKCIA